LPEFLRLLRASGSSALPRIEAARRFAPPPPIWGAVL
jgi:hypothetical protein